MDGAGLPWRRTRSKMMACAAPAKPSRTPKTTAQMESPTSPVYSRRPTSRSLMGIVRILQRRAPMWPQFAVHLQLGQLDEAEAASGSTFGALQPPATNPSDHLDRKWASLPLGPRPPDRSVHSTIRRFHGPSLAGARPGGAWRSRATSMGGISVQFCQRTTKSSEPPSKAGSSSASTTNPAAKQAASSALRGR